MIKVSTFPSFFETQKEVSNDVGEELASFLSFGRSFFFSKISSFFLLRVSRREISLAVSLAVGPHPVPLFFARSKCRFALFKSGLRKEEKEFTFCSFFSYTQGDATYLYSDERHKKRRKEERAKTRPRAQQPRTTSERKRERVWW